MSTDYILETQNLTKDFRGFVAVDGVNLKVRAGTIHALIGMPGPAQGGKRSPPRKVKSVLAALRILLAPPPDHERSTSSDSEES